MERKTIEIYPNLMRKKVWDEYFVIDADTNKPLEDLESDTNGAAEVIFDNDSVTMRISCVAPIDEIDVYPLGEHTKKTLPLSLLNIINYCIVNDIGFVKFKPALYGIGYEDDAYSIREGVKLDKTAILPHFPIYNWDYVCAVDKDGYPDFNPVEDKDKIVKFIREWFAENGTAKTSAVIGISGGKDSTITAALCAEALGADRVIGVLMPNGTQKDLKDALDVVHCLGIKYRIVNIENAFNSMLCAIEGKPNDLSVFKRLTEGKGLESDDPFELHITDVLLQNLAPRLRMATLYAVAQGLPEGGRVINTCNRSEDYVGYSTKYGDSAGDVAPLASYTVDEVLAIGDELRGIPNRLVHKTPSDGLCGKSDEDNLGFTYAVLDKYIKTGECDDEKIKDKIDRRHKMNLHKISPMPVVER